MMKLKNILLSTVVIALGLTACSIEKEEIPSEGGVAPFTLVMSTGETQTKAQTETTTPATELEAKVSKVHVAVFDVTNTAIGDTANAKRVATFGSTFSYENKTTTINITNLVAGSSEGKARKYFFYVIANSDSNFGDETQFGTYGGYQSFVETTAPSKYVKVGRKEVSLYWENSKPSVSTVNMDLIQLTARIDFNGIIEAETNEGSLSENPKPAFTVTSVSYYEGGLNGNSKIAIYNTGKLENDIFLSIKPAIEKDKSFYTYETNGSVKLLIKGTWSILKTVAGQIEKSYVITLPTLIKGNCYAIRGTAVPSVDVTPTVNWEVINLTTVNVTIPDFE